MSAKVEGSSFGMTSIHDSNMRRLQPNQYQYSRPTDQLCRADTVVLYPLCRSHITIFDACTKDAPLTVAT